MSLGSWFRFRTQAVKPTYAQEVLDAGWVPLPVQAIDATVRAVESVVPAVATEQEADVPDLLARYYANQAC